MKIFIASVLALYISLACAHSSISEPISYRTRARALYCKGAECKKACPEYYRNTALMRNTIERPARTYRRGQRIDLRWTRNNHFGGIMRVSLVPVKKMDSRTWHHRLTLMHGCWSNNRHICRKNEYCGTDRTKSAFETKLTIPTIFPDGMYVMGFLWYGGLRQGRGKFQDYYTCSFVRIKGGLPVGGSHKPYFEPGNGAENEGGKCKTSTDYPGPCERNGCRGKKAILAVPKAVRRGMDKIFPNLVRSAM